MRMSLTTASPKDIGGVLRTRLLARRGEIAQTIQARVQAVSPAEGGEDPEYEEGLRSAVQAAVEYAIAMIEIPEGEDPEAPPPILLEQARSAARRGVGLDVVLRRYCIGYALLGNVLVEEAAASGVLGETSLRRLLWRQADLFDRLIVAVSSEHASELRPRPQSPSRRRLERIERILAGEPLDLLDSGYELDGWHVGIVGEDATAADAIRSLERSLDRRLILVERPSGGVWAWLGGRDRLSPDAVERQLAETRPRRSHIAIGEAGAGRAGWCRTHQQARAALPIVRQSEAGFVRYRDVALLSSVSRDRLLATSLRELYLTPLAKGADGGKTLIETLRAYFASDRNISATAAALEVNRRTVTNRLRTVEERIGCSLLTGTAELEAALRLEELESSPAGYTG